MLVSQQAENLKTFVRGFESIIVECALQMVQLVVQSSGQASKRRVCLLSSKYVYSCPPSAPRPSARTRRTPLSSSPRFFFALEWYQEREQASYDYTDDVPIALSAVLIVPIAIQTVAFLVGSVFASKAIYNWHKSGFYSNTGEDGPQHPLLV